MYSNIENANYYRDGRNQAPKPVTVYSDEFGEIELPVKWVVCSACRGEGKYVNPSIDAGGLGGSLGAWLGDDDFSRDYMAGVYDVPCECCQGRSTVQEVDREACDPELLKAYDEQEEENRRYERERYFEIMAGC